MRLKNNTDLFPGPDKEQLDDGALRLATTLQKPLRASDLAGRLGGEEFAEPMPHTDPAGAMCLAEGGAGRDCRAANSLRRP